MVVVVSSERPQRVVLTALCTRRGWPCVECDSVRSARRTLLRVQPRVVVVRHQLNDGYSDDVIGLLRASDTRTPARVIVLAAAGLTAPVEARQIVLGADVVHRDPIRIEVVLAQIDRYRAVGHSQLSRRRNGPAKSLVFAGARIDPLKRTLRHGRRVVELTPREVELVRVLNDSDGQVATYELLYSEILGRPFRGDTSNMRVLLGKLTSSFRAAKLDLRSSVEVIPKSGYRYRTNAEA